MTLKDAMTMYLLARVADGLSPASVRWYDAILRPFVTQHGSRELTAIDAGIIRQHLAERRGQIAPASFSSLNTAMHAFWNWCETEYRLRDNPMRNIRRARPPQAQPKAVSAADFRRMFEASEDSETGIRDRALLAMLADTGARPAGLVALTRGNLHIDKGYAVVTEKGTKTRRVVFTHATGRFLHQWLALRETQADAIFTSANTGEGLTYWGLYLAVKRLAQRAGVRGYSSPKAFRHAFAREYILSGGDLVTLARLMGHASPDTTTAFYAVFSAPEVAALHQNHSPLLRLLGG